MAEPIKVDFNDNKNGGGTTKEVLIPPGISFPCVPAKADDSAGAADRRKGVNLICPGTGQGFGEKTSPAGEKDTRAQPARHGPDTDMESGEGYDREADRETCAGRAESRHDGGRPRRDCPAGQRGPGCAAAFHAGRALRYGEHLRALLCQALQ